MKLIYLFATHSLNDSFFLDNEVAVGEFAKKEVNNVYKNLKDIIEGRKNDD